MKILLVEKYQDGNKNCKFETSLLDELAEKEDIEIVHSFEQAQNYIDYNLINEKKYIDFVLINCDSQNLDSASKFSKNLKNNNESYFKGYFNLNSLNCMLFCDYIVNKQVYTNTLFDKIIYKHYRPNMILQEIGNTINNWRQKLAGDLDNLNLGLKVDFSKYDSTKINLSKFQDLKILSNRFLMDRMGFNFLWLGDNLFELDISINEFNSLIKSNCSLKEKAIHDYFRTHKKLLLGEYKNDFAYEKQLYYKSSRKYIEIDFVNYMNPNYVGNHEAFEVKRPEKRMLRKRGTGFYSYVNSYFKQVDKYFNYLTDSENESEIKRRLKINNLKFDYTLLFSRDEYVNNIQESINDKLSKYSFNLNLITYDDIINKFDRFYERTRKYMIS